MKLFPLHSVLHRPTPISLLTLKQKKPLSLILHGMDTSFSKPQQDRGWRIGHLWYTHAHFDHIGGAAAIADALNPLPHVALHPDDHVLWRAGGGGAVFGFDIDPGPEPTIDFVTWHDSQTWFQ